MKFLDRILTNLGLPTDQASKSTKIGFCGGMANNCYVAAKGIDDTKVRPLFIRDRLDTYAISQPIWEDARLSMDQETLPQTSGWSAKQWKDLEVEAGWTGPNWVVDPDSFELEAILKKPLDLPVSSRSLRSKHLDTEAIALIADVTENQPHHLPFRWQVYVHLMQRCDYLFVSSTNTLMLALISGVPFFICPAGAEFMVASGLIKGDGDAKPVLETQRKLLMAAFRNCIATVSSTRKSANAPLVGGNDVWMQNFDPLPYANIGLPFTPETLRTRDEKRALLNATLKELKQPPLNHDYVIFVPSRIDYVWKGQDRLLEALERLDMPKEIAVVCTSWGADYEDFQERSIAYPENFRFLNGAVSKPIMLDLYRGADITFDQLTLGHYGTATRESIATGTPSICWLSHSNEEQDDALVLAPVFDLQTVDELIGLLSDLLTGKLDLAARAEAGLDWTRRYSSPSVFTAQIERAIGQYVDARR